MISKHLEFYRLNSWLGDLFDNALAGGGRRQWLAILLEDFEPLIDDLTKLGIYFGFIVAVATLTNDSRALADKALVFVGPFNDFYVPCAVVHDFDSWMTFLTSRS